MRFVRIYFDTPKFDRITKDRAAKFVDMLSAIGGTMGLLEVIGSCRGEPLERLQEKREAS